jgi:hypothetical protein
VMGSLTPSGHCGHGTASSGAGHLSACASDLLSEDLSYRIDLCCVLTCRIMTDPEASLLHDGLYGLAQRYEIDSAFEAPV